MKDGVHLQNRQRAGMRQAATLCDRRALLAALVMVGGLRAIKPNDKTSMRPNKRPILEARVRIRPGLIE